MENELAARILDRIGSLVERWDKQRFTEGNTPLQGLIQELKQLAEEEGEGLSKE